MKTCLSLLALFLLMNVFVSADNGGASSKFKIMTKKDDDSVEVRADKDKTLFVVKSPSGISQAVIERKEDKWPRVVVRLHLKGLERFRASNGKVMLDTAISFQDRKLKVRMWKDGKEVAPLGEKSPFWMEIRILTSDGTPTKEIPLKDGYFEMALPKAFFEGNPKSITLNWIDFYR